MRNLSKKAKTIIAGAAIAGLASTGVAYAYWTNSGSGTGSAQTGTNVPITVKQTGSTLANLYPGGPATVLSGNFDNGNDSKVYVAHVTVTIPTFSSRTDPDKPTCTDADFKIDVATVPVGAEVDAGTAKGTWTGLMVSLKDNPDFNQDNCKLVTLPLSYSSN